MNPLDCQANIWINANAGSGKTTILIRRIFALILNGAKPQNIVAITYTNVGADEIKKRFFDTIVEWKDLNDKAISGRLKDIVENVNDEHIETAKNLFDRIILSGITLSVYTIHAFCYKILEDISSDIDSNFIVMPIDNNQAENEIFNKVVEKTFIFLDEIAQFGSDLQRESANYFLLNLGEQACQEFIKAVLQEDFSNFNNAKINDLLCIFEEDLVYNLDKKLYNILINYNLESLAESLKSCGIYAVGRSEKLKKWLNLSVEDRIEYLDLVYEVFLNSDSQIGTNYAKKSANPQDEIDFSNISSILYDFIVQKNNLIMYNFTLIFPVISDFIHKTYNDLKNDYQIWDYNDVLNKTLNILQDQNNLWFLYKISYKIDHFLLDEAQDTNEKSWQIIENLTSDFFDGQGANQNIKTIFVVGDEKQSIFSFQGAKFDLFNQKRQLFENKSKIASIPFFNIDLNISYRSSQVIIDFINKFCSDQTIRNSISTSNIKHFVCERMSKIEGEIKIIEIDPPETKKEQTLLEKLEADNIQGIEYLEATYNAVIDLKNNGFENKDIMILMRKRSSKNDIMFNLFNYLTNKNIAVSNIGKININKHIVFYDFLSILKFLDNQEDDLNLACLLNSVFCDIGFEKIDSLCKERILANQNLWTYICGMPIGLYLQEIIEFYIKNGIQNSLWHILYNLNYIDKIKNYFGENGQQIALILLDKLSGIDFTCLSLKQIIDKFTKLSELIESSYISEENAILLSTIHGSKGLESKAIILIDVVDNINKDISFAQGSLLKLTNQDVCILLGDYQNSAICDFVKRQKQIIKTEEMRLLYVALTRSCQNITIITKKNKTIKQDADIYNNWGSIVKNIKH